MDITQQEMSSFSTDAAGILEKSWIITEMGLCTLGNILIDQFKVLKSCANKVQRIIQSYRVLNSKD